MGIFYVNSIIPDHLRRDFDVYRRGEGGSLLGKLTGSMKLAKKKA